MKSFYELYRKINANKLFEQDMVMPQMPGQPAPAAPQLGDLGSKPNDSGVPGMPQNGPPGMEGTPSAPDASAEETQEGDENQDNVDKPEGVDESTPEGKFMSALTKIEDALGEMKEKGSGIDEDREEMISDLLKMIKRNFEKGSQEGGDEEGDGSQGPPIGDPSVMAGMDDKSGENADAAGMSNAGMMNMPNQDAGQAQPQAESYIDKFNSFFENKNFLKINEAGDFDQNTRYSIPGSTARNLEKMSDKGKELAAKWASSAESDLEDAGGKYRVGGDFSGAKRDPYRNIRIAFNNLHGKEKDMVSSCDSPQEFHVDNFWKVFHPKDTIHSIETSNEDPDTGEMIYKKYNAIKVKEFEIADGNDGLKKIEKFVLPGKDQTDAANHFSPRSGYSLGAPHVPTVNDLKNWDLLRQSSTWEPKFDEKGNLQQGGFPGAAEACFNGKVIDRMEYCGWIPPKYIYRKENFAKRKLAGSSVEYFVDTKTAAKWDEANKKKSDLKNSWKDLFNSLKTMLANDKNFSYLKKPVTDNKINFSEIKTIMLMVNNGQFSGDEKLKSQVLEIGKKSAKIVDDIKKIKLVPLPNSIFVLPSDQCSWFSDPELTAGMARNYSGGERPAPDMAPKKKIRAFRKFKFKPLEGKPRKKDYANPEDYEKALSLYNLKNEKEKMRQRAGHDIEKRARENPDMAKAPIGINYDLINNMKPASNESYEEFYRRKDSLNETVRRIEENKNTEI